MRKNRPNGYYHVKISYHEGWHISYWNGVEWHFNGGRLNDRHMEQVSDAPIPEPVGIDNQNQKYSSDYYQPLFNHMLQEHGVTLLQSEMKEIIHITEAMLQTDYEEKRKQAVGLGLIKETKFTSWVTGQYDRLYDQLKADPQRKVICWVDYSWRLKDANPVMFRDICTVWGERLEFVSRGHGYGGADLMIGWDDERKYFLDECNRLHVEWLDESGGASVDDVINFSEWCKMLPYNFIRGIGWHCNATGQTFTTEKLFSDFKAHWADFKREVKP
jgi:hypothetical protein